MNEAKKCTICKEELVSDSTAEYYCSLCGMIIEKDRMRASIFGSITKLFCCAFCYDKYSEFNNI
ncbi:hypothetical protein ACFL1B_01640 [Nanoarchaeota archaeon]